MATHFTKAEFPREGAQLRGEVVTVFLYSGEEGRPRDLLNDGVTNRRHERVSVERATLIAGFENAYIFARQQGRQRDAGSDAFAQGHHIRTNAGVFEVKHAAGSSDSGLDFVKHEEDAELACEFSQALQKLVGKGYDSGFSLNGFQHDGRRVRADRPARSGEVVPGYANEAGDSGLVETLPLRLS